jgi:type II secretory pathway pseudopilin PulG
MKKLKSGQGFSLIELLVIIFIIALVTSIIIVNFRSGDKRKTLRIGTEEVVSLIKDAQNRALLGEAKKETLSQGGYGVYLTLNHPYCILFQDLNQNRKYDGPKDPPFNQEREGLTNEYLEHLKIRKDLIIQRILKDSKVLRELEIVFVPPRPTIYYANATNVTKGEIFLGLENIEDQREIFINCLSGQIDVRSLEGGELQGDQKE